jgi:hypothetical protein
MTRLIDSGIMLLDGYVAEQAGKFDCSLLARSPADVDPRVAAVEL